MSGGVKAALSGIKQKKAARTVFCPCREASDATYIGWRHPTCLYRPKDVERMVRSARSEYHAMELDVSPAASGMT